MPGFRPVIKALAKQYEITPDINHTFNNYDLHILRVG